MCISTLLFCLCINLNTTCAQAKVFKSADDDCQTSLKEGSLIVELDPYEGPYEITWPDNSQTKEIIQKKSKSYSFDELGQGRHYVSVQNSVGCFNLMVIEMFDEQCNPELALGAKNQNLGHASSVTLQSLDDEEVSQIDDKPTIINDLEFSIYPNPFTDVLQINVPQLTDNSTLLITNSQGRTIVSHPLKQTSITFETSDFPPGIYNMILFNKNRGPQTIKLVKLN